MTTTRVLPQPHEGIRGVLRAQDPLLVNQDASDLALRLGYRLYAASLNATPNARALYETMTNPRVGDRVIVQDAAWMRDDADRFRAVGYLIARREEWGTTDEDWDAQKAGDSALIDADRYAELRAWYVQYGPNPVDVCRWTNCTVLTLEESDTPEKRDA